MIISSNNENADVYSKARNVDKIYVGLSQQSFHVALGAAVSKYTESKASGTEVQVEAFILGKYIAGGGW